MAYTFKRGNTFELSGTVEIVQAGAPVTDLTGWTGTSTVRDVNNKLISTLILSILNPLTMLVKVRQTAEDTRLWPIGTLYMDIRFTAPNGDIVNTSTAEINVVKEITNA
jgi:hypothetical protein